MKYITFLLTMLLIFMFDNGYGQKINQNNYKGIAQRNADSAKITLQLSDQQTQQMKSVEEKFFAAILPDKDSANLEARKVKIEKFQKEREEALKKILTAEQWNKYNEQINQQRQKYQERLRELREKQENKNN